MPELVLDKLISKKLSEDGMHVMLVGRRTEKLEETKILCKNNVDICFGMSVTQKKLKICIKTLKKNLENRPFV